MPDTIARTRAILREVRAYPITESADWKSRFSSFRSVRLFDLAPNRPTFYPDANGHFRGQVRLTIHEDESLPSGKPVTASQTLFALVEGHVTPEDRVTIEKVELETP
jgi:hypothetical protein